MSFSFISCWTSVTALVSYLRHHYLMSFFSMFLTCVNKTRLVKPAPCLDSLTRRTGALCPSASLTSLPVSGVTLWPWRPPWPMKILRIMLLRVSVYIHLMLRNTLLNSPLLTEYVSLPLVLFSSLLLPVRDLYLSTGGKLHRCWVRVDDIQPDYNAANQRQGKNWRLLSGLLQHV